MRWQLENAGCLSSERCNTEPGEVLDDVDYFVVIVQIDQVERKEHSKGMHALGGNDPESFIKLELEFADEALQTQKSRIRRGNS